MKIMLGMPIRRFDCTEQVRDLFFWSHGMEAKHEVRFYMDTSYGIDVARSRLIEFAKQWGAELLLMVDSDCQIRIAWKDVLSIINQAWARNYGLLISPTISINGSIMVWNAKDKPPFSRPTDIPVGQAFEIDWAALGFAAFRGEALFKLKVLKEAKFLNAPNHPLYCEYIQGGDGEDKSLCENFAASTGYKVGCDTRLFVDHLKLFGRPSWRGADFMPK
jgi:hypothetical protein